MCRCYIKLNPKIYEVEPFSKAFDKGFSSDTFVLFAKATAKDIVAAATKTPQASWSVK